jgi:uncharacterized protein YggU (UPF0235/DUF167 family)
LAGRGTAFIAVSGGLRLKVRLTPKSGSDRVEGVEEAGLGPALKVRVRAAASKGAANSALTNLLASWLGVPKSCIAVVAGAKQRRKTLLIAGDSQQLIELISARLGQQNPRAATGEVR